MIRRPPRSTRVRSSAASDVYKRQSLLKRAKELGMDSLALTDHGAMYAAIDFYVAAKDLEMKPIIGVEAYLAPGSRFDRKGRGEDRPYHLLLLAKDYSGYQNLVQLTSQANLEG